MVKRYHTSFPSSCYGFDSRYPLQENTLSIYKIIIKFAFTAQILSFDKRRLCSVVFDQILWFFNLTVSAPLTCGLQPATSFGPIDGVPQ